MTRFPSTLALAALALSFAWGASAFAQDEDPVVLITGFKPWGRRTNNPSWEGAKLLQGEMIEGHLVKALEIDVDYRKVDVALPAFIKGVPQPAAVIHFGVAGSRDLRFEQKARNQASWVRDDGGYAPIDNRVAADGPMIYTSELPEAELVAGMEAAGFPLLTSGNAGSYLCEYTFYTGLYQREKLGQRSSAGFIHVPYFREVGHHRVAKRLELHVAPDSESEVVGRLPRNARLEVLKIEDGWASVLYSRAVRFVPADVLEPGPPAVNGESLAAGMRELIAIVLRKRKADAALDEAERIEADPSGAESGLEESGPEESGPEESGPEESAAEDSAVQEAAAGADSTPFVDQPIAASETKRERRKRLREERKQRRRERKEAKAKAASEKIKAEKPEGPPKSGLVDSLPQ